MSPSLDTSYPPDLSTIIIIIMIIMIIIIIIIIIVIVFICSVLFCYQVIGRSCIFICLRLGKAETHKDECTKFAPWLWWWALGRHPSLQVPKQLRGFWYLLTVRVGHPTSSWVIDYRSWPSYFCSCWVIFWFLSMIRQQKETIQVTCLEIPGCHNHSIHSFTGCRSLRVEAKHHQMEK